MPVLHPVGDGRHEKNGMDVWLSNAGGIIALFFLPWYDDPQSYAITYGIDGFFDTLISGIRWLTAAFGLITTALLIIAWRVETATPRCVENTS